MSAIPKPIRDTILASLASTCPEAFDRIWLRAKRRRGSTSVSAYFSPASAPKVYRPLDFAAGAAIALADVCTELWKQMKASGEPVWSSLTVEFRHDGTYTTEPRYDDFSSPDFDVVRYQDEWRERHFAGLKYEPEG